jgi:hypothetical protein
MKLSLPIERAGLFGIKSRMYKVTVDGNMTIIEAGSPKEARQMAIDDIDITVDLATQEDIEWYNGMSREI